MELKLDPETGNTILLLGASKTGKTTKAMELYNQYFKKYVTTLFAGNPQISLYQAYPKLIVVDGFPSYGNDYIEIEKTVNKNTGNSYNFLNIFDDILDTRHKKLVNESIISLRNSKISTIMCLQNVKLIAKASRGNINNIFFFGFNTDEDILDVVKTYLSSFFRRLGINLLDDMINLYRKLTANHNFLYLHPCTGYFYSSMKGVLFDKYQ